MTPTQPTLLDVPATHRSALEVWKAREGVRTHFLEGDEWPWLAVAYSAAVKLGYGAKDGQSIGELYANVGRLISEGGYDAEGKTEEEACQNWAVKHGIPLWNEEPGPKPTQPHDVERAGNF